MNLPATFDPIEFGRILWPDNRFTDYQEEMVRAVRDSVETKVVACNGSGKDHTTGFIVTSFTIAPWLYYGREFHDDVWHSTPESWSLMMRHTRRCVTTSVAEDHLRVLWAEVAKWLETCSVPLLVKDGGPLVLNDLELRWASEMHLKRPPNYTIGMVAERPEKFSGHHARYSLAVGDEASGLPDACDERFPPWAKRRLYFGNAEVCVNKFFRAGFERGDVRADHPVNGAVWLNRSLRISADDSPNVRRAKEQIAAGREPTGETVTLGVVSWADYVERRKNLDKIRQSVVLDAQWYDGAEVKLISSAWFEDARAFARARPSAHGTVRYMGCDPAEGGDDTCWVVIDPHGVLDVVSLKTPDTNVIFGRTLDLMRRWDVADVNVAFDRGAGQAHVDRLRAAGHVGVRSVGFGTLKAEPKRGIKVFPEKRATVESQGEFVHRRSQMYHELRELLERPLTEADAADDPIVLDAVRRTAQLPMPAKPRFALPSPLCDEIVRQLAVVPLTYDELGRFKLLPKTDPNDPDNPKTLKYLLGRSPDQADALALAVHAWRVKPNRQTAGAT